MINLHSFCIDEDCHPLFCSGQFEFGTVMA